jgi:hypothetical protein
MVGYLLGLGDRHTNNIMLDLHTGGFFFFFIITKNLNDLLLHFLKSWHAYFYFFIMCRRINSH